MNNLKTTYLGIPLLNPVIVSSSRLTATVESVAACEKAGAGAVVLKSLFEEQIAADKEEVMDHVNYLNHVEAFDYASVMAQEYLLDDYLSLVSGAKEAVKIPVIASLNCVTAGKWIEYARLLEDAGADALELNVFIIPANKQIPGNLIEKTYLEIARKVKRKLNIPVTMKIGSHFSGLANFIENLANEGIDGVVLFNRFYKPDIDIETLKLKAAPILSNPVEMGLSLQWIALLSGEIDIDFTATTGVASYEEVVKQLLAGAKTVEMCSALYRNGVDYIKTVLSGLSEWMDKHQFSSISDFNGKLCQEKSDFPEAYERSQFVKAIVGIS